MVRTILAILVGLITAGVVIALVELIGIQLYPPPPGLNPNDPNAFARSIAAMPAGALGFVVLAWTIGSFAGGYVAGRISRLHPFGAALAVGGCLLAAVAALLLTQPHPLWMNVLGPIAPILGSWLASRLVRRKPVAPV